MLTRFHAVDRASPFVQVTSIILSVLAQRIYGRNRVLVLSIHITIFCVIAFSCRTSIARLDTLPQAELLLAHDAIVAGRRVMGYPGFAHG